MIGWSVRTVPVLAGLLVLAGLGAPARSAAWNDQEFRPVVSAFHVHSTVSTGNLTLEELAGQVEKMGLDAVVLTENFVLSYEYGLFPLRGVLRQTYALPSALDYGLDRYLGEVASVQSRHPRIVMIPGVEIVPHYYWTGSLWSRNLTMYNAQRNLLMFGPTRAEAYAGLPINGNPASYRKGWESAGLAAPVVLLALAGWLWQKKTYKKVKVGVQTYRTAKRHRVAAGLLAVVGGLLLFKAWPIGEPVFSAYDAQLGYKPAQAVIDWARSKGGAVLWSMPEAVDFHEYSFGPLGVVTIKTDPYPESLLQTTNYTGFGGVYQDTRTVSNPGGVWDQTLLQYLAGQRPAPPYAFGEIAFHRSGHAGKELDQVVTVFWVRQRSAAAVMEAAQQGRFYSVGQYRKEYGLRLDQFFVDCDGGTRKAGSGERLEPKEARDIGVRVAISATDGGAHPLSVILIRSGQVVSKVSGVTPFEQYFQDETLQPGGPNFYRLAVEGEEELLSNPIFVGPVQAAVIPPPPIGEPTP